MNNLIYLYINKLTLNDIYSFATKNNVILSESEANFVFNFIKNNYQEILNNPNLDIDKYKSNFTEENFNKIKKLITFYSNKYSKYLN